jgi:DNA-binding response OmpR family regulator
VADVAASARAVAVLADDLIWATRLADALGAAGAEPRRVRRLDDLRALLAGGTVSFVIVDLTARAYDGVEAVRAAAAAGARIVAVGQHDDAVLRKAALAAGAERVYAYRKLFEDGPRTLGAWLAG